MFKVLFEIQVAQRKNSDLGIDFQAHGTMPFVPSIGMQIAALPGDDYRKVELVYWRAEAPDQIQVYFEFDEFNTPKHMRELGWRAAK